MLIGEDPGINHRLYKVDKIRLCNITYVINRGLYTQERDKSDDKIQKEII